MEDSKHATDEVAPIIPEDPSLAQGHRALYDRQVMIEVRRGNDPKVGSSGGELKRFNVKVLLLGEDDAPESIRIELSSEEDLFFHYSSTTDSHSFDHLRTRQKLMIQFQSYAGVLIKTLNRCIAEPHKFMSVLHIGQQGKGRLNFVQNMEYKFVDLLSIRFQKSFDDFIHRQVNYRYKIMKEEVERMKCKLEGLTNTVRLRNPSLLLQTAKVQKLPFDSLILS